jgi:GGDEF domain-containing protein
MRIFDRIDPENVERRERELWLLAVAVIAVLALGVALLMYPHLFSREVVLTGPSLRTTFFSFCGLAALLILYLVDRHLVLRQLRKQLTEALLHNTKLRHQASSDLLAALPGFGDFQDRLAMEFLRASSTREPLSVLVVLLLPAREISGTPEAISAFGDAGNALRRRLRPDDALYLAGTGTFVILLPGIGLADARQRSDRLAEGLTDASGASNRFGLELQIINYPRHANSVREIEAAVRSLFAQGADAVAGRDVTWPSVDAASERDVTSLVTK